MFDHTHYVPILKWKQGEYLALETMEDDIRDRTFPVLEVVPVTLGEDDDELTPELVANHLRKVPTQLARAWPSRPAFVDLHHLQAAARMPSGEHPVEHLFREFAEHDLACIPVCGPDRDAAYQAAVADVVAREGRGVCIRLMSDELFDEDVVDNVTKLLRKLKVPIDNADLLMDVGEVPSNTGLIVRSLRQTGSHLAGMGAWRTFTFAGGSFPESLRTITGFGTIPRVEWYVWNELLKGPLGKKRVPTFGDYAVQHPDMAESAGFSGSANVRYTGENEWFIFRGRSLTHYGYEQYHDLCREIVRHAAYSARGFSWGDSFIYKCARNEESTGNASTWRKVGTSHHITFAVRQVAKQFGISI
ncbi:beta family protein [Myxococcus sp. CA040A]|uniref:beta family protein n=1 Tax=Myxococcus sp. CA040A TaxID=2741738 RepID=UPI00157B8A92|nr:beta family protein [Myxococcus sp. CA040A]NTX07032.1 beta family protein [Myxococcus sp. CA040A]